MESQINFFQFFKNAPNLLHYNYGMIVSMC